MNTKNPARNFVAIDVEWATREQMICQIGLAVVRNGEITDRQEWLIQPPDNIYDEQLFRNHHIRPEMTENAPTLEELWPEIQPYLLSGELWAHNAVSAEIPAFQKSLGEYNMSAEWLSINDSRDLFQRPDCNGGNGLEQCAKAMSIPFEEGAHHNALYDAEVLAEILIRYAEGYRPHWEDVPVNAEQLRKSKQEKRVLRLGEFADHAAKQKEAEEPVCKDGVMDLFADKDRSILDLDLFAELSSTYEGAQPQVVDVFDKGDKMQKKGEDLVDIARLDTSDNNPLRKKRVAMTGAFHIKQEEIERAIEAMGGTTDGMTRKTDILLVGNRNVGLPKLVRYEKQVAERSVSLCVGDADLEALLYGDGHKFFKEL